MRNHKTFYLLSWAATLLIALVACNTGSETERHTDSSVTDTIRPPVKIKAGMPVIHHLRDYPPPQIIDLITKPEPVKIPADFFVTMQNFNTEHGLALSSILSGFKDKAGNLWFGTYGNGVSKYDGKSFTN
jgi:hypothetical protein